MRDEIVSRPLDRININGGTQPRVETNEQVITEYAEAIQLGLKLPPIVAFDDGSELWLADGFHRYHAHRNAGTAEIDCEVRQGSKRDAILFSCGANAAHGLRRTNADKHKSVMTLLNDPEWSAWSANEIAQRCGVSHTFVNGIRSSLETVSSDKPVERTVKTKHGTVSTMNTTNIGKAKKPKQHIPKAETVAMASGPERKAAEVAQPDPEPENFGPSEEEIQADERVRQEQIDSLSRIAESDDKMAASLVEVKRLSAINCALEARIKGFQNENNALIRQVKSLKRKLDAQGKAAS
jgi:hypothetical protein